MKKAISHYVYGIAMVAAGIFVIVRPETVVNIAALIFSLFLFIKGVWKLIGTLRFEKAISSVRVDGEGLGGDEMKGARGILLCDALLSFIIGVVTFAFSLHAFISRSTGILRVMVHIVALGFLLSALAAWMEERRTRGWTGFDSPGTESVVAPLVAGIVLFLFPFLVGKVVMNILGAVIIASGALVFYQGIVIRGSRKKTDAEDATWRDAPSD